MSASTSQAEAEVIEATRTLLAAITQKKWSVYKDLCDGAITCFEPEALGHLVEGLEFHGYYFIQLGEKDKERGTPGPQNTMANIKVHMLGSDAAVVAYVRLVQIVTGVEVKTVQYEETRVWRKDFQGKWKNIHFHRSKPTLSMDRSDS